MDEAYKLEDTGGYIYDVYLNITNPMGFDRLDREVFRRIYLAKYNKFVWTYTDATKALLKTVGIKSDDEKLEFQAYCKKLLSDNKDLFHGYGDLQLFDIVKNPEFRDIILKHNPSCDGLICADDGGSTITYGCFYANQIKSISNKMPTEDNNIDK